MRELNEEEIRAWIRVPGNTTFRYQLHAQGLGYLSMIGAGLLGVSIILWVQSDLNRDILFSVILGLAFLNLFIAMRVATSMWFVARNVLGLSDTELLIVRGYKGTIIPLSAIRSSDVGWSDDARRSAVINLPIKVEGRKFNLRIVALYYALENFHVFIGGLLEHISDNSLSPKDTI